MPHSVHSESGDDPIAIVGMGCRMPGGVRDIPGLWEFLRDQRPAHQEFAEPRFSAKGFYHPNPDRPGTTAAKEGFLLTEDPRLFDAAFFGITDIEAETMDASQRKLLEITYEAFENAGETWESMSGSRTGVFVGDISFDNYVTQVRDCDYAGKYSATGSFPNMLANRLHYIFNLTGPSVVLNSACTSGMYALHMAITAMRNGDCDTAIVAGSNWIMDPTGHIAMGKLAALSPSSRSHTFDARGDGYARGEGFAALFLKKASQAMNDGSPIRALVMGSAINANGRTSGITKPSGAAQEAVIRKAYENAGNLNPSETTLLECHGTGTRVGDPIEVAAAGNVFSPGRSNDVEDRLLIGSVKTNLGHLEGAAALPGILKVIVALEAGQIPPSLGVETLNPRIDFEKAKVHVVTDVVPWPKDKLKRASVTSAGFGGTNGHCIIDHVGNHFPSYIKPGIISQELDSKPNPSALHEKSALAPPMASRADADTRRMVVLPFSAHNENSLKSNMEVLTNVIGKHSLADVAYTLAAKRSRLARRAFQIVDKTSVDGGFVDQAFFKAPSKQSHVAFVFTGQGAQWHAMGAELMEYRVFQDSLASLDNILSKLPQPPSWKLSDVLRGNCEDSFIQRPEISQAACTGLQIGLVDLLASWSVRPAAVVGHSSGEMAAAYAAGAISAAEAITAAYFRGQNVSNNKQKGAMLAVGFGPDTAAKYLVDLNDKVKIAAINSPESMTLSGDADAVTELSERLNDEGVFNRLLKTGGLAYHSHHMLPLGSGYSEELSAGIARLKDQGVFEETKKFSSVPWISSVQPEESVSEQTDMAPYWRANLESPVRFSEAVAKLLSLEDLKVGAFIEIGPHPALKSPLRQIAQSLGQTVTHIATVKRSEDAMKTMLALAGSLFGINAEVNLVAVNAVDDESQKTGLAHGCMAVDLPPYQYTYGPINYHESRISKEYRLRKTPHHDLLGSRVVGTTRLRPQWRNLIRIKDIPWLDDHRVPPHVLFPGAAHIIMSTVAAEQAYNDFPDALPVVGYALRNVAIKKTLVIPEDHHGIEIVVSMEFEDTATAKTPGWGSFSVSSIVRDTDQWTEHCSGFVKVEVSEFEPPAPIDLTMDARPVEPQAWYTRFADLGLQFGPSFQGYSDLRADPSKNLTSAQIALKTTKDLFPGGESYYPLHPASFDLVIRLGLIACNGGQSELASVQLPIHMSRMRLKKAHHDPKDEWATACGRGELRGLRGAYSQLQMFDKSGNVALEVENLRFTSLNNEQQQVDGSRASKAFSAPFTRLVWRPDIRSLNNEQIQTIIPSTEENISQIPLLQSIDRLAALVVSEILDNGREIDTPKELLDWIKAQASSGSKSMESARGLSVNERQKEIEELSQATSHVAESKVIQQIYNSLSSEENQRDSESVLAIESANPKSSSLFQGVYAQIAKLFDLLGHANPAQRILELKTDAAGPTPDIVKALAGPNGIKRYQSYTLASQSKDVLASLRELMSESRDIHYSTLDVTEPLAEVPQNDKYDVILFAHLRNSQDVQQSLANAKQLLKIGGKIVLLEQAHENTWATLVNLQLNSSSTLPRDDKYWDSALRQAGFSGIDLNIRDFPEGHSYAKVMVSTSEDQNDLSNGTANGNADLQAPTIFLLHGSSGPPKLLQGLATELERRGMRVTISPIDNAIESIGASARVVAFLDGENLLLDADQNRLSIFQHITSHSDSMVWVTSCGMVKGRNPDGAFVAGLLRGLGTENPTGQFMSIDVDAEHFEVGPRELKNLASCLADQEQALQHRPDDESNEVNRDFAWQDGCLWVSRVVPDDGIQGYAEAVKTPSADDEDMEHRLLSDQGPVRAAFATPGILTSLYFRPYTELLQPLPHDWIDVKVNAIGLNWKDLGLSSGRFDGHNLSSEYCGVVSAKGSSVQHLEIGDRVYGMGKGHFGNFTRVPAVTAQKLHQNDDAVVMATMPLVYMTAVYAFEHVVRLRKGQKVLIQSASGGLGLAAIELARAKGAEVFVTAGTPDKIRYLVEEMNVPPENVFSSRDASDVPRMIKATRNDGFDVILSTAQGDMLYESLKALAPLGHLIDVGRMDVTSSKSIALELFQKSAGFTSFDLGLVVDRDVAFGGELMKAVDEHYRAGRIGPIKAYTVSDVSQLDQVLLRFAKGTHIGKLVLNYQNPESKVRMQRTAVVPAQFDPEARYVLVGGLSGLGRAIVRWMSERGARDMLVLSRGGEKTVNAEGQALIKELASRDIRITVAACDVSNRKQTLQTVKAAAEDRAVRGVIHYAVDYQDISFDKMTLDKWNEGMAAKISGTKNLHEATLSLPLDFFVMTSSIGTIYAFPTQSTYTGANNFLDYFARYRRAQGLPASTLCMGFISDVGNLIHDPVTVNMIARAKALPITGNQFLRLLEPAILGSTAHAHAPATSQWLGRVDDPLSEANLFTALDPAALAALKRSEGSNAAGSGSLPRWYSDPRVSLIIQALDQAGRHYSDGNSASAHDAASTEGKSAAAQMRGQFDMAIKKIRDLGSDGAAVEERKAAREFVTDAIVTSVAGMLFMDKADVNPANTVADHGIDSLLAAEFRNWLHVAFRKHISMLDLMDARTSIDLLATSILDEALSK